MFRGRLLTTAPLVRPIVTIFDAVTALTAQDTIGAVGALELN